MSSHDQLVTALAITAFLAAVPAGLMLYLLYRLFWDAFDFCMQRYKRWRNNWLRINRERIDSGYRTGQFITPRSK